MSHATYAWVISHMNESLYCTHITNDPCHTWMSHVTYTWVLSHTNQSCHTRMSHVTWVMLHMHESCHICMSQLTYAWVTLLYTHYEWSMSHMNEWCPIQTISWHTWASRVTYEWVMTHMNESCHIRMIDFIYERLWMNHIWSSNESWLAYLWVMSHVWMSHVSCLTYNKSLVPHMNEPSGILNRAFEPLLSIPHIRMIHVTYEWVTPHASESCHIWMSNATHEWVMSHTWMSISHIQKWAHPWYITYKNESCHRSMCHFTYGWVMSHLRMSHVSCAKEPLLSVSRKGWLRLVGSSKL